MGYLSLIFLESKFGAPTRISEAKFGAKPPQPPDMKVPPPGAAIGRELTTVFDVCSLVCYIHSPKQNFSLIPEVSRNLFVHSFFLQGLVNVNIAF